MVNHSKLRAKEPEPEPTARELRAKGRSKQNSGGDDAGGSSEVCAVEPLS